MKGRKKIAVILNPKTVDKTYVVNYLASIERYAPKEVDVYFFPAKMGHSSNEAICYDFSSFDAVLITFHIRPWLKGWSNIPLEKALKDYLGRKVVLLHDEYDQTESMRSWVLEVGINVVYTVVPQEYIDKVYNSSRFSDVEVISTLTSRVPFLLPDVDLIPKISDREKHIVYRGRRPNPWMGELVKEKYEIGRYFYKYERKQDLIFDIESNEDKRIYGLKWYDFLMSGKATLGTESGCNVFDVNGKVREWFEKNPKRTHDQVPSELNMKEGNIGVYMNQVSPKIFEAVICKTALILFEGSYSGVIKPDLHYIPLKKDYSNIESVIKSLKDDVFLDEMVERTYEHVVGNSIYSYSMFVENLFNSIPVIKDKELTHNRDVVRGVSFYELLSQSQTKKQKKSNYQLILSRSYYLLRQFIFRSYYLSRRRIIKAVKPVIKKYGK